jgi:hypothetical protein
MEGLMQFLSHAEVIIVKVGIVAAAAIFVYKFISHELSR